MPARAEKGRSMTITYRRPNTRRCYWQCLGCLKGYNHKCSPKYAGYLSVAKARRLIQENERDPEATT